MKEGTEATQLLTHVCVCVCVCVCVSWRGFGVFEIYLE